MKKANIFSVSPVKKMALGLVSPLFAGLFGLVALTIASLPYEQVEAVEKTAFTEVLFDAAPSVKVQIGNDTFYLLSIDGVKRADLFTRCEAVFKEQCACYFAEKFTETMTKIGHPVGETVALRLYNFQNHQVTEIPSRPVSEENQMELRVARELRNGLCFQ